MLDRVFRIGLLFDFYGALLTDKQQYCLEMHFLRDLSLSEIADELSVSRQAVHDISRRAEQILEEYEAKLKLVERYQRERNLLGEIYSIINSLPPEAAELPQIHLTLEKLEQLLD
ncbi:MAG TPA: DNA-binding protein [Sporomusaceae bacterium]|uniref:YlxM family DNA-binding protein n=1 Tax=Anaerospora sp. TaxID=1960278 RepID=UPI000ECF14C6|nr:YlxM family DNA-binding protein [Anaerospora sp.]HAK74321.1 DNA-binding protein [Sporomusaceae bacterium]